MENTMFSANGPLAEDVILIVEDGLSHPSILEGAFKEKLPQTLTFVASSGKEALALSQRYPAAPVFIDLKLPDMTGEDLGAFLMQQNPYRVLVAVSNSTQRIKKLRERLDPFALVLSKRNFPTQHLQDLVLLLLIKRDLRWVSEILCESRKNAGVCPLPDATLCTPQQEASCLSLCAEVVEAVMSA